MHRSFFEIRELDRSTDGIQCGRWTKGPRSDQGTGNSLTYGGGKPFRVAASVPLVFFAPALTPSASLTSAIYIPL
jgi:hypothetical protein